jgi:CheY-like chemotaxis protein
MIYGFVKQSGGGVDVRSDVGRGTVVTMFLPEARDSEVPESVESVEASSGGNGETILVAEDEPELLTLASRFLTELGYRVITAPNGAAAMDAAARAAHIDLVLTDVVMPGGMSGLDLASAIRSRRPETRVVFVSGYADRELTDKRPKATDQIISKPYDRRELARAVQHALKDRSAG